METVSHFYTPEEIFNLKKNDYTLPEVVSNNLDKILNVLVSRNNTKKTFTKYSSNNWNNNKYISVIGGQNQEKIKKDITSILNKISNNNFESSLQEINKIISKDSSDDISEFITETIFKNSIKQSIFCKNYVKILLTIKSDEIINKKITDFDDYIFEQKNPKHYKIGYACFITEIFNIGLFSYEVLSFIINNIVQKILKNKSLSEDYIESLFQINKIMRDKEFLHKLLSKDIEMLVSDKEIPSRCRFKLMDIKDTFN